MKILYISSASSKRLINDIYNHTGINPGYAVQNFSRLLIKGLSKNNTDILTLSNPPITRDVDKSIYVKIHNENEEGIVYHYIPFVNIPLLKYICIFLYTFCYVLFWGTTDKNNKAIICDVLSISACLAALMASKMNGLKSVAVVTDIYSQMIGKNKTGFSFFLNCAAGRLQKWYSTSFSHYVLLTEQMKELVNPHKRPYIVMEALCDTSLSEDEIINTPKDTPRYILYAGGIEEKYGLECLVKGFCSIPRNDIKLVLYGHGSYVEGIKAFSKKDSRIEYRGIAPTEDVIKAEIKATLLINPRFSTEEFAMYSFPSKNMEYMTTGTPLLTTKLPGMSDEYYPYVYLFEEETPRGYAESIEHILSLGDEELKEKGYKAREFVLNNKNNIKQTLRIIYLLHQ